MTTLTTFLRAKCSAIARILGLAACLAVPVASVNAAIIGVTGDGVLMDPSTQSTGIAANFFNDVNDPPIRGWNEMQNVALQQSIIVDIVAPGTYSSPFTSALATIPQGKVVSSHLLFFDPQQSTTVSDVTFEFDGDIIGIIVSNRVPDGAGGFVDRFVDSDFLGNPDTDMTNGAYNLRGLEFGPEVVTLDAGLRELTLSLRASSPGDQVRVITMQPIPEPATIVMLGFALLAMGALVRPPARERLY